MKRATNGLQRVSSVVEASQLHQHLLERGVFWGNKLIVTYGNCGCTDGSRRVFDGILDRNVSTWNAMLSAYARNGHLQEARAFFRSMPCWDIVSWNTLIGKLAKLESFQLFYEMKANGIQWDRITVMGILQACTRVSEAEEVVHNSSVELLDTTVTTTLIKTYGRCGGVDKAREAFDNCLERDVIVWTAMMNAYAQNGHFFLVVEMFERMPSRTSVTWNGLVVAYAQSGQYVQAQTAIRSMPEANVVSWTSLITACVRSGHNREAIRIFSCMINEGLKPAQASYLAILDAASELEDVELDRFVQEDIIGYGETTHHTELASKMIHMFGKCGNMEMAKGLFDTVQLSSLKCEASPWNALIGGYSQNGRYSEAFEVFKRLVLEGIEPTRVTFIAALEACKSLSEVELVCCLSPEEDETVRVSLMNAYGKHGDFEKARMVFYALKCTRSDAVVWTAVIAACSSNGHHSEAISIVREMELEGVLLNKFTFATVLYACSHGGFMGYARDFLVRMGTDYEGLHMVDHYVCMVDLLGRLGCLQDALDLLQNMPFEPGVVAWTSFLGAWRTQYFEAVEYIDNADLAREIVEARCGKLKGADLIELESNKRKNAIYRMPMSI